MDTEQDPTSEFTGVPAFGSYHRYPPSLRGDPDLPKELLESALSRIGVTRTP